MVKLISDWMQRIEARGISLLSGRGATMLLARPAPKYAIKPYNALAAPARCGNGSRQPVIAFGIMNPMHKKMLSSGSMMIQIFMAMLYVQRSIVVLAPVIHRIPISSIRETLNRVISVLLRQVPSAYPESIVAEIQPYSIVEWPSVFCMINGVVTL